MPTSFDTVIDRALITVNDYKLRKLYNQDLDRYNQNQSFSKTLSKYIFIYILGSKNSCSC